jgi:hypothetical protein
MSWTRLAEGVVVVERLHVLMLLLAEGEAEVEE